MTAPYTYSYIKSRLEEWGFWREAHLGQETGLPTSNILENFGCGGSGIKGHRILCLVMPKRVMQTQLAVAQQPEIYREALEAWYVYQVKPGGDSWTAKEKAEAMGLGYHAFRWRVGQARKRLCEGWLAYC